MFELPGSDLQSSPVYKLPSLGTGIEFTEGVDDMDDVVLPGVIIFPDQIGDARTGVDKIVKLGSRKNYGTGTRIPDQRRIERTNTERMRGDKAAYERFRAQLNEDVLRRKYSGDFRRANEARNGGADFTLDN